MSIEELNKLYNDMIEKGKVVGLTKKDYVKIKKAMETINSLDVGYYSDLSEIYFKLKNLNSFLFYKGLFNYWSEEVVSYITMESPILSLVLSNNGDNKINLFGDNSYMFLCQFHREKTPSYGVTDWKNMAHCFGCGVGHNTISYLEVYENLSFRESIRLLSKVFLYDIKNQIADSKLDELAKKYQETVLSDQYYELLLKGEERKKRRGLETNDITFQKRCNMIERIRKGEYDPNFEHKEQKKKIYIPKDCRIEEIYL